MNRKIARILVPALIIVAVAMIWLLKSQQLPTTTLPSSDMAISLEITSVNLEEIKAHGLPVLLDFGADSCVPCKEMAPILIKLNEELQGKAIIHFTDVWKHPEAGKDFPIQVIPSQVLINADGTPYVPSDSITSSISGFQMYSLKETDEHIFTVHQGGLTEEQMRSILADMGVMQ